MFSSNGLFLVLAVLFFCLGYRRRQRRGKSLLSRLFRRRKKVGSDIQYTPDDLEFILSQNRAYNKRQQEESLERERLKGVDADEK